jgi:hypothetical protein
LGWDAQVVDYRLLLVLSFRQIQCAQVFGVGPIRAENDLVPAKSGVRKMSDAVLVSGPVVR